MEELLKSIVDDDQVAIEGLLSRDPSRAVELVTEARLYEGRIFHWIYAGDTALHLAAAGYRVAIAKMLVAAGADPNAAFNHRRGTPLHYAADGYILGHEWDAARQVQTIDFLVASGSNVNAQDKNGASPLHRAVRTRCSAAVRSLIQAGADPLMRNKPGSTPFHLAVQNTGRGSSGSDEARAAQREIIETFLGLGLSPATKDANGRSVMDWARSDWVREALTEKAV
jgi:ankyrin repeat protein